MLGFAEEAHEIGAGRSGGDIATDRTLSLAIERCLELIGEAANRLSPALRERYPDVDWRQIVKFRNVLVHWYDIIDYDLIAETLADDVPRLIEELRRIIEQETP
jgi:uncharacterized protein with HEPN domain